MPKFEEHIRVRSKARSGGLMTYVSIDNRDITHKNGRLINLLEDGLRNVGRARHAGSIPINDGLNLKRIIIFERLCSSYERPLDKAAVCCVGQIRLPGIKNKARHERHYQLHSH